MTQEDCVWWCAHWYSRLGYTSWQLAWRDFTSRVDRGETLMEIEKELRETYETRHHLRHRRHHRAAR